MNFHIDPKLGALIQGVGLPCLFVAWIAFKRARRSDWNTTTGEVIDFKYGRKGTRAPIVRFRTPLGVEATCTGICTSPCPYVVGQIVPIIFDPQEPARACIHTFIQQWGIECCVGFIVLLFSVPPILYGLGLIK